MNITDEELINELKKRFEGNVKYLEEQHELMEQLKIVNSKLLASEHVKSNFLSNIRNEINNPIASVLELSKYIANGDSDLVQTQKYARLIHSEIFSLDFQLRNIFFSAEVEAGEASLSVVNINPSSIVQNVLLSFQHLIGKKNLIIVNSNNIPSNVGFKTDSEKLYLIISNLIANAIQFSHEGGTIKLGSSIDENELTFSVTDNGCGISDESRTLIFDRFRQGEEGATKNYSGHGLGLSITKALLEIINGQINVSGEENKGSTFTITIKCSANDSEFSNVVSSDGNDFLFDDAESLNF
jgi:signal transduction histidine kinase